MGGQLKKLGLVLLGAVIGFSLTLNFSAVAERPQAGTPLPIEELRTFSEVFGRIKSDYVEPVDDHKLIKEAITGMVAGLDPHSAYLDQDAYKELQAGTQGEFGGLGIEVTMEDGLVRVVSPIDDTPASRAGIKPGDLIIKLDEMAVKGMTLNDAVKRMRGKPDTQITLTLVRKNAPKPIVVTLTRSVIKMKSIKLKEVEPGYASIRVSQFQEHTGEDLAAAVEKFYKDNKGAVKGLVLDLRNDPGGLLNAAVGVSAVFLPQDALVVYTEGRVPDAKMRLTVEPENYLRNPTESDYVAGLPAVVKKIPMVVLVNSGSASASEIVAGALQDHHRATIMGVRTFGKGSVQTILPLSNNTALKLTTARYFTPSGRSIQAKGIEPDVVVPEDPDMTEASLGIREADLEGHLSNPTDSKAGTGADAAAATAAAKAAAAKAQEAAAKPAHKPEAKLENGKEKPDYQLNQAITFLKRKQPKTN
ncbi:MAG: S41 family peptidase [Betaproteobacteria bacterium]|nr:S41 family peptidase [Betaproteobacteria bacterium]MDE1982061.1 S41 family peptidase [Betaproteobacteria bacterium]MDE2131533.1 S41 family peptidase [Betaproteobacteria bacterium]MDE2212006.1 S41 family peptidase [Betaproteobacteria bacterium]